MRSIYEESLNKVDNITEQIPGVISTTLQMTIKKTTPLTILISVILSMLTKENGKI